MIPDHYATLGVGPTAKASEIRATYLALMREYHPDRNSDPAAADRAQGVIAAFKVLGDFDRRNHYDWARRREREAAQKSVTKRSRWTGSGAVAAGAVGLAAVSAWLFIPEAEPRTDQGRAEMPEVRAAPVALPKARSKVEKTQAEMVEPSRPIAVIKGPAIERIPTAETLKPKTKVEQSPSVRVASAAKLEAPSRSDRAVKSPAKAVRPLLKPTAPTSGDLASLDQFVMGFYGQSWRYGDARKRAALVKSHENFVVRRAECSAEGCKRAAYLKLLRDVSDIVETGAPKAR